MAALEPFRWLAQWYLNHCNGEWEHRYGVSIETLDNPGWSLTIDLAGTPLEGRKFEPARHGKPSDNLEEWQSLGSSWVCDLEGDQFKGSCGPLDLSSVINIFRAWSSSR